MDRLKLDEVIALIAGVLRPAGYDCIEADWVANDKILRLFIDNFQDAAEAAGKTSPAAPAAAGINLDGCVKASKLLEEVPALDALIGGPYTLEVSSPGVERPLRRRQDFERFLGEKVQVRLASKVQDRRNGVGTLRHVAPLGAGKTGKTASLVEDTLITLETDQGEWSFPLERLQRASLVYDWGNA